MYSVRYRRWTPPGSHLQIEFPAKLLERLSHEPYPDCHRGFLLGIRYGKDIRLMSALPDGGAKEWESLSRESRSTSGVGADLLHLVGVFIRRDRGEVFLTETDLEWFERQGVDLALVMVGVRAGFFVRQANGSIQTVCSHEEFTILPEQKPVSSNVLRAKPAARRRSGRNSARVRKSARYAGFALATVLAGPLAAFAYFRPISAVPVDLHLRSKGEVAIVSWNRQATARGGHLEIFDGGEKKVVELVAGQSSLSYIPHSVALEFQLTASAPGSGFGSDPLQESGRLIMAVVPQPRREAQEEAKTVADLQSAIAELEDQSAGLGASTAEGQERILKLQKTIAQLTSVKPKRR